MKRDLLENLNRFRKDRKLGQLYVELMPNMIAERYAGYLLDNDHSETEFKRM